MYDSSKLTNSPVYSYQSTSFAVSQKVVLIAEWHVTADEFSSDEDTFPDLPDLELAELVVPPPSSECIR